MGNRIHPLTDYGLTVRKKLLELNQNPTWLCEKISSTGGCYMDTQYLNKILSGKINSKSRVALIDQILTEEEERQNEHRN